MTKAAYATIGILVAILIAALWLAFQGWTIHTDTDAPMSIHGYIAMGLGIFFSLLFGCGLMALTFYSSRQGYDDLPQARELPVDGAGVALTSSGRDGNDSHHEKPARPIPE